MLPTPIASRNDSTAPPHRWRRTKRPLFALAAPLMLLLAGCPQGVAPNDGDKDNRATQSPFNVEAITPNRGFTFGGTRVTIRGGPFESDVGVLFGAHAGIDPVIVNSQMITALTPPQAAGVVDVKVLANGGELTVLGAFTYDLEPEVSIHSIFPNTGVVAGGTEVTIAGENFTPYTIVLFGEAVARDIEVLDGQVLVATTPAHGVGPVDVTVKIGGSKDVLTHGFEYVEPVPRIDSVEPSRGPIEGGTQVTLRGEYLPADGGVLFGAVAATEVTFVNEQIVTAIAPAVPGPDVVDIILVYNGGQLVLPAAYEYFIDGPVVDDGTDSDGDGLTDVQEETGWEVWIENFGLQLGVDTFGNVTRYAVTSDPLDEDSDDDGLTDKIELLIRSDPRKYDSDDDGLWDGEEWNQWLTSPTSVDTDADARGDRNLQNAPNQALFDGMELFDAAVLRLPPGDPLRVVRARATSPTLMDTDADGVSDFDEFDSTVRNGVLSDLPRLEYELVGDVDVRLNVEYAETVGQTKEYGVTLTESQTDTVASSFSNTIGWSVDVSVEQEIEYGPFAFGGTTLGITAGVHGEYTWTNSVESAHESSEEHSRLQSDSREFTESAADGSIRTAILLRNRGNTTFTVAGLSVLVMQREKVKDDGDTEVETPLKTIATMSPSFETLGLDPVRPTLAPGEVAGPFELAANEVNAETIKELLARPDSLLLGTASMNFQDEDGLDYDFIREFTVAQTANITIDFGDGEVRTYNVATNVDRNPDSTFRGITLQRVFEEMLKLPYGDPAQGYTTMADPSGRQVLQSLLGREFTAGPGGARQNYWVVVTNNDAHTTADLNDVVLHAGDELHLFFSRDDDGDGLSNTLEKAAGTDQEPVSDADADGDGLTDKFEVLDGWIAFEDPASPDAPHPDGFEKRRVFSDPRAPDADQDGLSDAQELAARSNPADPDTDGDSLNDGQDPFPIRRAGVRFVKADAVAGGNGRTWDTAYTTIQQALADAAAGQASAALADDDVAQVWVARGEYRPASQNAPLAMVNNVGIYGGFSGPSVNFAGETKRGQRLTNAFSNGCVITGDLAGNDVGEIELNNPGSRAENCPQLVVAAAGVNSSALLDGFMLTAAFNANSAATGGALATTGSPLIQNCLFFKNGNAGNGGGIGVGGGSPTFKKCTVAENAAQFGGGVRVANAGHVVFEDCEFTQNEARVVGDPIAPTGGGIRISNGSHVDLVRCSFMGNKAHSTGAGVWADGPGIYVRIDSCRFYDNLITYTSGPNWIGSGAGAFLDADASVSNSVFWGNHSKNWGGAIAAFRRCTITNCTVAFNRTLEGGAGAGIVTGSRFGHSGNLTVENTISWANWYGSDALPNNPPYAEHLDILRWDSALLSVRNSCFDAPLLYRGNNNIGEDPEFMDLELGDLRLDFNSPCTDRGNTFVDVDPLVPGLQALPLLDFFGKPRIVDGNSDGFVSVDMGASEVQAQ